MIAQKVRNHQGAARSQSANVLEPLNPTSALLPCQHQMQNWRHPRHSINAR